MVVRLDGPVLADFGGQPAERTFKPLALQVGHVIVRLGSQREQRPAVRSTSASPAWC